MNESREWQLRVPAEGVSFSARCSRVGDIYRLESVPVASETIAYGDTFEADQRGEELVLRRVVQRTNRRNYSFAISDEARESTQLADLLRMIEGAGGVWDRVFGGLLLISMPPDSNYDPTADMVALDSA